MNTKKSYPIKERNIMLGEFFAYHGFKNAVLIGDENQPKIILDDMKVVCGFVKNKIYNFTNKQFGGEIIYVIDLNKKEVEDSEFIKKIVLSADRKKVHRLQILHTNMFYVKTENLVPLFSNKESRYFFDLEKALSIQNYLETVHSMETVLI